MSSCSMVNGARLINVPPVVGVDSRVANNELSPQLNTVGTGHPRCSYQDSGPVHGNKTGMENTLGGLNALIVLLTSFITQLLGLVSNKENAITPDTTPPAEVSPKVVPEPLAPKPSPVVDIQGLSNKRNGEKPENIWSGFRQGPDGNCVTVSAIKAAMHRFGQSPTDIFKEVRKVDDGYRVVMRDDFQLTLSTRELAEGARGAQFYGPDSGMLKDAQFLFAVSAKRAQMENNDGTAGRSYSAAIRSLNNGEDEYGAGEGFIRLGLRKHMKKVPVRQLAGGQVGMCNRNGHSVAVINGREESWGRQGSVPTRGDAVALM